MKLLVLLLLLTSWTHLGSEARGCDPVAVISGQILNIIGSQRAKANVTSLHAYNRGSRQSCLEDCCLGVYGRCSVASYRNHSSEVNCLHFYCQPLSKCKFFPSTFFDSYTFPEGATLSRKNDSTKIKSKIVASVLKKFHIGKTHPRSVSARKGVENVVVSRKGILPDVFNLDDLSLKNDNTTIKPRKGVEFSTELTTETSTSVIKPRKGVEVEEYFFNETGSKIKPRKGVGPFLPHTISMQTVSSYVEHTPTTVVNKEHSKELSILTTAAAAAVSLSLSTPVWSRDTELFSVLQNVFSDDETDTNDSSVAVPFASTSAPHGSSLHEMTKALPVPEFTSSGSHLDLQTSFTPLPTTAIHSLEVPQTAVLEVQTTSWLDSKLGAITSSLKSETTQTNKHISSAQPSSSSVDTVPLPRSRYSQISKLVAHGTLSTYQKLTSIDPSSSSSIIWSTQVLATSSIKRHESHPLVSSSNSIKSENERRYKSSMHLVLSLVFGLLVLCTVMGVVAKRIYDVWMRRHYHRMDFLIDGLYDGYS